MPLLIIHRADTGAHLFLHLKDTCLRHMCISTTIVTPAWMHGDKIDSVDRRNDVDFV